MAKNQVVTFVKTEKSEKKSKPNFNQRTHMMVFNEERKKYDAWIINVDTETQETEIEVEPLRFSEQTRAFLELQKRLADDFMKGNKK